MYLHTSKRAKIVADGQVSRASEVAATAVKAARGLEKRVAAKTSEVEILRTVVADTAHQRKVWAPFFFPVASPPHPPFTPTAAAPICRPTLNTTRLWVLPLEPTPRRG
jgi:hypothetical protein